MSKAEPIRILAQDLSPWRGQDKALLEIAWQLNQEFPLEIHSYSIEGYQDWPNMRHEAYSCLWPKNPLLRNINFQLKAWQKNRHTDSMISQSVGTSALSSDVIHVQFLQHSWRKVMGKLPPFKLQSHSLRENLSNSLWNWYRTYLETKIYQPNKKYVAVSHSMKKELMESFKIPQNNIEVIYLGVDSEHFYPVESKAESLEVRQKMRRDLGFKDRDFVLLHVGALDARKGLYKTLEVLSFLHQHQFDQVKVLAIGQGEAKKLDDYSRQLDIADQVVFLPHSKDVRAHYWAADALFFPTYYEPFGLIVLEAMASGLPVVISELAGVSELIDQGYNGLLFNPWQSVEDVANHLLPLLRDPQQAQAMAQQGRITAQANDWQKVGQAYRQFYQKLQQATSTS